MKNPTRKPVFLLLATAVASLAIVLPYPAADQPAPVALAKAGAAQLPLLAGSVKEPVNELRHYLKEITGAEFKIEEPQKGKTGLHVGLATDFPWMDFGDLTSLGAEGFLVKTEAGSVYLIAKERPGVAHAVTSYLHMLGCRWFFPGKTWEVIPEKKTIEGAWNDRQVPSFPVQRHFALGFGAYPEPAKDFAAWNHHNHMGGPQPVAIGHTWAGLDPKTEFEKNPEWFALAAGKRKASKPCYSHPEVIKRAIEHGLVQAAKGSAMISMSPPDGLGYCECERCQAVFQGGKPYTESGTTFAKRPDGVLVNITSETLFNCVNEVAKAVAEKHPKTLVGCYAYSAYSHPPSFKLHPNVFLQTTTAFRRTPLTMTEQLEAFQKTGVQTGIRGYFSVYQWDWDYPAVAKGELSLPRLVNDLRFFRKCNVQSVNAESCCNWAPRGPGYYLAARLMWNTSDDPKAILADFYDQAFGPAALPMERYYVRWLGSYVAIRTKPAGASSTDTPPAKEKLQDELDNANYKPADGFTRETLKAAFKDLDEAAALLKERPRERARVDQLRLYAHYLYLRIKLEEAAKTKDKDKVREAVQNETVFGARLTNTSMIHSRPLIGKEFYRRFLPYKEYLEGTPEWPQSTSAAVAAAAGKGYRKVRSDVPEREELDRLWTEDKAGLGIQ